MNPSANKFRIMSRLAKAALLAVPLLVVAAHFSALAYTTNDAATGFTAYSNAFYRVSGKTNAWFVVEQTGGGPLTVWQQAEEIECVIDAYEWTGNTNCQAMITNLLNGFLYNNGGDWTGTTGHWSGANDDVMWTILAFLRGGMDTGNPEYCALAKTNFDAIYARGWDTNFMGGGMWWWYPTDSYKSACINGPTACAASLLYEYYGDRSYWNRASNVYFWERSVLFNTNNGNVCDGIQTNANTVANPMSGSLNTTPTTYNQGTFLGAANFLGLTNDAVLAADYTMNSMTTSGGILPQYGSGGGNNDGFNAIFIRWMERFIRSQGAQSAAAAVYQPWLQSNANAAWQVRRSSDNLSWCQWLQSTPSGTLYSWDCIASLEALQVSPTLISPTNPVITRQPASLTCCVGGTAVFSVAAAGQPPLAYQWSKNSLPISGWTNAALTLTDLQPNDAARYTVSVANTVGSVNSAAATLMVVAPSGYSAVVCGDAPVAYYPLNETNGTVAFDWISGCNGTYLNGPTLGIAGATTNTGTAVALYGQYIDIANDAALNFSGEITLEAWAAPTSTNNGGYIIAHSADSNWDELWLRFDGSGDYQFGTWGAANSYVTVPVPAGTLGRWVHLVGTYDGAHWNLYQNGVLLGSQAASRGVFPISCDWGIGSGTGQAYGRFFDGGIQQVAIYNHALSLQQVQQHYFQGQYGVTNQSELAPFQITLSGAVVTLTWPGGTLQQSVAVTGPYSDVAGATSPYHPPVGLGQRFYRVRF